MEVGTQTQVYEKQVESPPTYEKFIAPTMTLQQRVQYSKERIEHSRITARIEEVNSCIHYPTLNNINYAADHAKDQWVVLWIRPKINNHFYWDLECDNHSEECPRPITRVYYGRHEGCISTAENVHWCLFKNDSEGFCARCIFMYVQSCVKNIPGTNIRMTETDDEFSIIYEWGDDVATLKII